MNFYKERYIIAKLIVFAFMTVAWLGCRSDANLQRGNVLKYNQPNSVSSLDPAFAKSQNNIWAVNHIFNGLVDLNSKLEVVPSIAKSWEISPDGKTYTFVLRDDVEFHKHDCLSSEDRIVTAEDVKYSLSRLLDPKVSSPGSWLFKGKVAKEPFEAVDDTTFVLHLAEPFVPMLGILAMQYCGVVPKECVESMGKDWRANPVGTGPYTFKRWEENQALFLRKNMSYFDTTDAGRGEDYVKVSFILDKQIAFYELKNGNLDLVSGLQSSFVNDVVTKQGQIQPKLEGKVNLHKTPYLNVEYLGINQILARNNDRNPLSIKEVRQALNYGIDKTKMLKGLRNGIGIAATGGFIPPSLPAFAGYDRGYNYNPEKAKELLKQANYYDGNFDPIVIKTNSEYLDLCTYVTRQWQDIGVDCNIEVVESATLREGMRKSAVEMFRASWIADYPDEESFLCMYYSPNPAPPNYTRFKSIDYDDMYDSAVAQSDVNKRRSIYRKMDSILIEEAPVIFLFYDESAVMTGASVNGFEGNGINLLNVETLHKEHQGM